MQWNYGDSTGSYGTPEAFLRVIQCCLFLLLESGEVSSKDILELATKLGIPTALFIGVLWLIYKTIWPIMLKQYQEAQAVLLKTMQDAQAQLKEERKEQKAEREKELDKFVKAIEHSHTTHATAIKDVVNEMRSMRDEFIRKK